MAQTYLITGASRGIGLEFVRQLTTRGDRVLATARDTRKAGDLAKTPARVLNLDVSSTTSISSLSDQVRAEPIDIMINNAGVSATSKSITSVTAEELQGVFLINSIAPMLVARTVLPNLRAGKRKLIVNISSQLGSITNNRGGFSYGYCASKAALNMLTVSLANELKPEGFCCIALHPGWVKTDMGGPGAPLSPEQAVGHMLATIDKLVASDTGKFLQYDGRTLPW